MNKSKNPRTQAPNIDLVDQDIALFEAYADIVREDRDRLDWFYKVAVHDHNQERDDAWRSQDIVARAGTEPPEEECPNSLYEFRTCLQAELEASRMVRARERVAGFGGAS